MKRIIWSFLFLILNISLIGCKDDDVPAIENEEEIIASVTLLFTPDTGGEALAFTYSDPDGEGGQNPIVEPIVLAANTAYTLSISLAGVNGENITAEVEAEADEHMFFFGWTHGLFSSPQGTGNIGSRSGDVDYQDKDANGQPLGVVTKWTTGTAATGTFSTILKHQPGSKTASSTVSTGETDIEIDWAITIQ